MRLKNVGYRQAVRCGWSDGRYRIPVGETAEVPDAIGERLLAQFPGAFVAVEDAVADVAVEAEQPADDDVTQVPRRRRRGGR